MPQPTIPTKEEFSRLPRRAVVAFAARCARRVQPIFAAWPGATQRHIVAVDRAISLAEAYGAAHAADVADVAHAAAHAAANAAAHAAANAAANAADAYAAAKAAANAADAYLGAKLAAAYAADYAADAAANAADAYDADAYDADDADDAAAAYANAREPLIAAMRRDYDLLAQAAQQQHWTHDTPVPPTFFGPLWPNGQPPGWPHPEIAQPSAIEIYLDPGNASKQTLQEVFQALSNLHLAAGGLGLEFSTDGASVFALEEVRK